MLRFLTATTEAVDLYVDGQLSKTISGLTLRGYDTCKIGSNLSATAGQTNFDDMLIQTTDVPEPASMTLLALAGSALLARRRH